MGFDACMALGVVDFAQFGVGEDVVGFCYFDEGGVGCGVVGVFVGVEFFGLRAVGFLDLG